MGQFARRQRDQDDGSAHLPLRAGPISNGEFVPAAESSRDRAVNQLIRSSIDDSSRWLGMDRRRFLQGAGAVAASLAAFELAGCTAAGTARSSPTTRPRGRGGTFTTPPPEDTAACQQALASNGEFIFDVHTHHVIPNGPWVQNSPETVGLVESMLPSGCADTPQLDCVDRASYLHDMFLASDTTVAMLTDVPNSGPSNAPIPFTEALSTQEITSGLVHGGAGRLLVENIIAPNVGSIGATLDEMSSAVQSGPPSAFKVYTAWSPSGQGFSLQDPTIGLPTVQHAHDLGIKVFVAHKGLPLVNFDPTFNHPDDMVALSRQFPDMNFVIYHAAWDPSQVEGPYDPNATVGIDTLLAALDRHQVAPNEPAPHPAGSGGPRAGQTVEPSGSAEGDVGNGRHLVRQPTGADHGHARVPDHRPVPGAVRLPRVDRRSEGGHLRPQCRQPLRARRHGHPLCPDHRSPQRQHCRIGRPARRRGASLGMVTSWSDHPAPGAQLAGLPCDPLDAVLDRSLPNDLARTRCGENHMPFGPRLTTGPGAVRRWCPRAGDGTRRETGDAASATGTGAPTRAGGRCHPSASRLHRHRPVIGIARDVLVSGCVDCATDLRHVDSPPLGS